jgi:murein hydrolase activator
MNAVFRMLPNWFSQLRYAAAPVAITILCSGYGFAAEVKSESTAKADPVAAIVKQADLGSSPSGVMLGGMPSGQDMQGALALAALDRKIADLDSEESAAKKELAELGARVGRAKTRVQSHGRAYYKLTRVGTLPLGGGFNAFVSHAMRVERARRMVAGDVVAEQHVREHGAALAKSLERVARERVELASQRTTMAAARIAVEDEARRQQAFDHAFNESAGGSEYVAIYGGSGAADSVAAGFGAARGRLLFPIAGRAEARIAQREGTGGPGVEIKAALGTQVRASYSGRVAFSDRYGPYGRLVILDHGDHYYTVSGNLASALVNVGDEVAAGAAIGTVGDEGRGPMLYFEVRHRTETVHPGPWLGLQQ